MSEKRRTCLFFSHIMLEIAVVESKTTKTLKKCWTLQTPNGSNWAKKKNKQRKKAGRVILPATQVATNSNNNNKKKKNCHLLGILTFC